MPQMGPINWLSLFIIFSISFMIFNVMNYYMYMCIMPQSKIKKFDSMSLNWKW
uniref:ATP synthase complex subunit 8 n=1 Tax=Helina latitarsis TaxID=2719067 RepID=A0A7G7CCX7_9MUSC|nr:ATP synthase F0 subunit 8 [Helina latitarsis]